MPFECPGCKTPLHHKTKTCSECGKELKEGWSKKAVKVEASPATAAAKKRGRPPKKRGRPPKKPDVFDHAIAAQESNMTLRELLQTARSLTNKGLDAETVKLIAKAGRNNKEEDLIIAMEELGHKKNQ